MNTTAVTGILVTAIAATAAGAAWQKPAAGSKADNTVAAILGFVMLPLGTMLLWLQAWAEISAVTTAAWILTVGSTRSRERIIWTVAASPAAMVLAWMAFKQ